MKSDGSALGNAMYFQSPNYKNIKGFCSFQNYVKIYSHQDDQILDVNKSEVLTLLGQKY